MNFKIVSFFEREFQFLKYLMYSLKITSTVKHMYIRILIITIKIMSKIYKTIWLLLWLTNLRIIIFHCEKCFILKINVNEVNDDTFYIEINKDKEPVTKNIFTYKKQYKYLFSYTIKFSNHYNLPFISMFPKCHKNPIQVYLFRKPF